MKPIDPTVSGLTYPNFNFKHENTSENGGGGNGSGNGVEEVGGLIQWRLLELELISYTVFCNWNWTQFHLKGNFHNPAISSLIHSAKIVFSAFQATQNLDEEMAKKEKNKKKKAAAKERKRERQEKAAEAPEAKKAKKGKKAKKAKKNKKNK